MEARGRADGRERDYPDVSNSEEHLFNGTQGSSPKFSYSLCPSICKCRRQWFIQGRALHEHYRKKLSHPPKIHLAALASSTRQVTTRALRNHIAHEEPPVAGGGVVLPQAPDHPRPSVLTLPMKNLL